MRYITDPSFRAMIDACLVTPGVGITPHAALESLSHLDLSNIPEICHLTPLRWLPNLTRLDLDGLGLFTDFSPLFDLSELRFLSLRGLDLTDS